MDNNALGYIKLLSRIRSFFERQGFLDIISPPMVSNPGMETHIHPFEVRSIKEDSSTGYYLHTSPEFYMKSLLSFKLEKIFSLGYVFRDEPVSSYHRPQFLMLEWYRAHQRYESIMSDCQQLIHFVSNELSLMDIKVETNLDLTRKTVDQLFSEVLNMSILEFLEKDELKQLIAKDFPSIHIPSEELLWEDYYFLLFLNQIEPALKEYPALLLYEYPHHLSALSTIKNDDPRVCERFEIYLGGIEIANCFNELTDLDMQKKRFANQESEKKRLYGYTLPTPAVLYDSLKRGLPESSGIAMGLERMYAGITGNPPPFMSPLL